MSYSVCLKCKDAVSSYQKYCEECEKIYTQNPYFWRDAGYGVLNDDEKRNKELMQDIKLIGGRKG